MERRRAFNTLKPQRSKFYQHSDNNHGTYYRFLRGVGTGYFLLWTPFQSGMRPQSTTIHTSAMRQHHKWNHYSKVEKGSWGFIMGYFYCEPFESGMRPSGKDIHKHNFNSHHFHNHGTDKLERDL